MAPRLPVALVVGAIACAVLAGCSESGPRLAGAPVTRMQYIDAVNGLMDPPAQLASAISARSSGASTDRTRRRLDELVTRAEDQLASFRALVLDDTIVRHQRDDIAAAYSAMIPRMRSAATALQPGSGPPPPGAVGPFLHSLRGLPSAASSSSR